MRADALPADLDEILFRIPDTVFRPTDDFLLAPFPELSRDPLRPLLDLRDKFSAIVPQSDSGDYGGLRLPNLYMQESGPTRFIVLGYDAHTGLMRDWETFGAGNGAFGPAEAAVGDFMTFLDGDEHLRQRKLMLQAFGRPAVLDWAGEMVGPLADQFAARLAHRLSNGQTVDLSRELALPYVFKVMAALFGLGDSQFPKFVENGSALFSAFSDFDAAIAGVEGLNELFAEEVDSRRKRPTSDFISWLMEAEIDGCRFSDEEVITQARFFLPAGIETTWRAISLMMIALLEDRGRYDSVCQSPDLAPVVVEEALRYSPPVFSVPRRAVSDGTIAGVAIPAGSFVLSFLPVVNRDPARWDEPNTFSPQRKNKSHAAFNTGPHVCIGMHLARLEMQTVLQALTRHVPGLRLAIDPADVEVLGMTLRTPAAVPVRGA